MKSTLSDYDLKHLRIFKAVVEGGGFTAAQANLNISISSISMHIKDLETRLGMVLCQRGRTGFKLTDHGEIIYTALIKVFSALDDFSKEAAEVKHNLTGELNIGLVDHCIGNPSFRMSESIQTFNQRDNTVTIKLSYLSATEMEQSVLDGSQHLAIGFFHHRIAALDYELLFTEEDYLYCSNDHPLYALADDDRSVERVQQAKYVSRGPIESHPTLAPSFPYTTRAVCENVEGLTLMVLSGEYIAYLPTHVAQPWVVQGRLKPILPETIGESVEFHRITRRGVRQSQVTQAFLEALDRNHAPRTAN